MEMSKLAYIVRLTDAKTHEILAGSIEGAIDGTS